MKLLTLLASLMLAATAGAEIKTINGVRYECRNGACMPVEDEEADNETAAAADETPVADETPAADEPDADADAVDEPVDDTPHTYVDDGKLWCCSNGVCWIVGDAEAVAPAPASAAAADLPAPSRQKLGYMNAKDFLAFLGGEDDGGLAGKAMWLVIVLALVGGLAMNITPCVLPMIPINLMIIGKSAARGAWYGLGIAVAYGTMGVLAAVGGMAFGQIQSNPWFNVAIAILFVALGLALSGVFFIDLSKNRGGLAKKKSSMLPWLFAFFMGLVSAVLAGACVAPILISVLILTAKLYAEGQVLALGLPFVLGVGMALPWPFLGAGLQVLPKPGGWMKWVNKGFAALVFVFAAYYGYLAWKGFRPAAAASENSAAVAGATAVTPAEFPAAFAAAKRPVFVDCWATWCKNCTMMEHTTLADPEVVSALSDYTVIRMQCEDISALRALPGCGEIRGLPAFLIYQ